MFDDTDSVAEQLTAHPRLVGGLFALTCLLASTGNAAAGFAANSGP